LSLATTDACHCSKRYHAPACMVTLSSDGPRRNHLTRKSGCSQKDLNFHGFPHWNLNPARLPFRHVSNSLVAISESITQETDKAKEFSDSVESSVIFIMEPPAGFEPTSLSLTRETALRRA
jgi:hypothetical protein